MRICYVVSYDISDDKRLRRVFKTLRGYGDHIQFSVFRCDLTRRERVELEADLADIIDYREDQVLFVDVGPSEGRADSSFDTLGRAYVVAPHAAVVV